MDDLAVGLFEILTVVCEDGETERFLVGVEVVVRAGFETADIFIDGDLEGAIDGTNNEGFDIINACFESSVPSNSSVLLSDDARTSLLLLIYSFLPIKLDFALSGKAENLIETTLLTLHIPFELA